MNNKTTHQKLTKEMKIENLINLKKIINDENYIKLSPINKEWGGGEVIITSSPDRVFDPKRDEDDWYGRKSSCTYVLTDNAILLSKLFHYVNENIMERRDFHLFHFMAFLANDYIKLFGDEHPNQLLNHIFYGIAAYCKYYDWEIANEESIIDFIRFFLYDKDMELI